jgi:hypothetical protein
MLDVKVRREVIREEHAHEYAVERGDDWHLGANVADSPEGASSLYRNVYRRAAERRA